MNERKTENRISTLLFAAAMTGLLLLAAASIAMPDRVRSELENRNLRQYTPLTLHGFLNGEWTSAYESYSLDQFSLREQTARTYFRVSDLAGVIERNGYVLGEKQCVLLTPDVSWGKITKTELQNYAKKRTDALAAIQKAGGDAKVIALQIPHKNYFYSGLYPKYYLYDTASSDRKRETMDQAIEENGFDLLETLPLMEEHRDEYIYFYTDNHYTFLGAYYTYQALLDHINRTYGEHLSFPAWEDCDYVREEDRFVGNYLKTFGDAGTMHADYLEYVVPKDYPVYTRYENGEKSDLPVLDPEQSDWSRFMTGNCPNTKITTGRPELPNILYIGYSYSNPLEYMSVYNFNEMHSLDLRYYEGDALEYIRENSFDYIVVIFTGDWEKVLELGES